MITQSRFARRAAVLAAGALVLVGVAAPSADAGTSQKTSVIYSSIPNPLKGNMPSLGFEAYSLDQLGDDVTFRSGGRRLTSATLTLSSWGCQSGGWTTKDCVTTSGATFAVPMTFVIYDASGQTVLAQSSATFAVPYRPSASSRCNGADAGKWWDPSLKACFNGFATNVTFSFDNLVVPDTIVWGVRYDTTHHGDNPIGESAACYGTSGGCGYDSLNIGLNTATGAPYYGETTPGTFWLDSSWAGLYCDGGAAGVDVFRVDSPAAPDCWTGYIPAVQFKSAA